MIKRPKQVERNQKNYLSNEKYQDYSERQFKNIYDYLDNETGNIPIGIGFDFYGTTAPENYMFADGSAISRTEYAELFSIIGTTYGTGDGSTTFNLPDKRERVSVMYKENSTNGTTGAILGTLGAKGGEFKHTQTVSEMPTHNHKMSNNTLLAYHSGIADINYGNTIGRVNEYQTDIQSYVDANGSSTPFNVMQPYIVCNYIIKVK